MNNGGLATERLKALFANSLPTAPIPKPLSFKGVLSSLSSRVDRSLSLHIKTTALDSSEKALFMELQQEPLDIKFSPQDAPHIPPEVINGQIRVKTQAERIRGVLYVLWEQQYKPKVGFEDFYKAKTEQIIEFYKSKLAREDNV